MKKARREEEMLEKDKLEKARQEKEKIYQVRRKLAPKFISAVRPKPTNSFAQGPDINAGFQTPRCPVTTEVNVFNSFTVMDPDPGPIFERHLWSIILSWKRYIFGRYRY